MYGKSLALDIHDCDVSKFNRKDIEAYLVELCDDVIDMERAELQWWDYEDEPEEYAKAPAHLKGVSCVQFIMTSTIVIHSLEDLGKVFMDIFSCKDFDEVATAKFTADYFGGEIKTQEAVIRV